MPGTLVKDNAYVLFSAATQTTNTNGSSIQVGIPNICRARLQVTGAVTGTTPTLSVAIQSSNDQATWTTEGTFTTVTASLGAGVEHFIDVDITQEYVRAVSTITGTTPSFAGVTVDLVEPRFHRKSYGAVDPA